MTTLQSLNKPVLTAIMLFIALIFSFFLVAPKYKEFKVLQQKLGEKQAEYDAKFAYYNEIAKVYSQLEAKKDIVEKIDTAIPENISYGSLLYFLQKKGMESGLIVKSLSLTKAAPKKSEENLKEINFSISLLGQYSSLKDFMDSLEKSARIFEVNSISFGATAVKQKSSEIQTVQAYPFQMEIKTFSY